MEDRLDELIAFSNKLEAFFDSILAEAAGLYPDGKLPRRGERTVLVHASLAAFGGNRTRGEGHVPGGAETVLAALLRSCAKKGMTVAMCAHADCPPGPGGVGSGGLSGPLVFDRRRTPCRGMGLLAEAFRTRHGVRRSGHPYLSFCALGPAARVLSRGHRCETGLGPGSPLGTLRDMDALVLMLGTGYETCTALHLAEYEKAARQQAEGKTPETVTCHAGIVRPFGAGTAWKCWKDIAFHAERFPAAGAAFEAACSEKLRTGRLENGIWRLARLRDVVEFSIDRCGVLE